MLCLWSLLLYQDHVKPFTGLRLMGSFLLSHHLSHFLRTPIPSLSLPYHCIACCCWCCCCQVASVVSDSVRPHRHQPTRFCRPWYFPGKSTGVGCHCLLQCVKVKSESEVTQLCPTSAIPWTAAFQAPPSIGFSRQEYWSGVPLPSLCNSCRASA